MTRHESTDSRDELRLRELLDDTVSRIEPEDRLDQILSRTKVTAMSSRQPWLWGAGGAALATAAVLTAVALVGNPLERADDPGPANPGITPTQGVEPTPTEPTKSSSAPAPSGGGALPVYYIGDTPQGPRLYREFQPNVDGTEPVSTAVSLALGSALDPDYRTGWPAGSSVTTAGLTPDQITIGLSGNLHDRPAGMTAAEAQLAIEQLIYTAQAAYGHGRVPVQFLLNDSHTNRLLGEPASEPLAEGTWYDTLALVNITDPSEGTHVSGTLHITGLASSYEAIVPWKILQGTKVVDQKFFMAEQGGDLIKLYPFAGDIDLSGLAPGTYTLVCSTDDPSGGAEGNGPTSDTRTIVVE